MLNQLHRVLRDTAAPQLNARALVRARNQPWIVKSHKLKFTSELSIINVHSVAILSLKCDC